METVSYVGVFDENTKVANVYYYKGIDESLIWYKDHFEKPINEPSYDRIVGRWKVKQAITNP